MKKITRDMEPTKYEQHMRSQLRRREIPPSAGSWEKLRIRLDAEQPERRSYFPKIAVAAAIAVVFFVLGTLWKTPEAGDQPVIVEESPTRIPASDTHKVILESKAVAAEDSIQAPSLKKRVPSEINHPAVERIATAGILEGTWPKGQGVKNPTITIDPGANIPEERSSSTVSDAEIEELLAGAMLEIEEPTDKDYVPISAEDLLDEVEYELDQNFRQKVFDIIKEGFSKAKTAIANRNQ